ncbi:MAG: hypothetical protein C4519_22870 [Desulfobacteraceae bacterium]|nr:MAG: hypothetical protein C4519_22870 [Desulfobacteraceae bacterium]
MKLTEYSKLIFSKSYQAVDWLRRGKKQLHRLQSGSGERVIIVHNHLFKNAGSSIDWALRNNFGNAFIDHRDNQKMLKGPSYLGPYLLNNPGIIALSTHQLRPPLPVLENTRILTIMMFRHPIERVTSAYNFERKQIGASTLGAKFARAHNLREYVLWRMLFDVPPTIRNFHIYRTLPLPADWRKDIGETQLTHAKSFVDSVEMIGFVERFDDSMVLFEEILRLFLPDVDLSYRIQNVGQRREESLAERIDRLQAEIGGDAFQLLMERNRADLELYEHARNLFAERLAEVPGFEAKRDDFKARCCRHNLH